MEHPPLNLSPSAEVISLFNMFLAFMRDHPEAGFVAQPRRQKDVEVITLDDSPEDTVPSTSSSREPDFPAVVPEEQSRLEPSVPADIQLLALLQTFNEQQMAMFLAYIRGRGGPQNKSSASSVAPAPAMTVEPGIPPNFPAPAPHIPAPAPSCSYSPITHRQQPLRSLAALVGEVGPPIVLIGQQQNHFPASSPESVEQPGNAHFPAPGPNLQERRVPATQSALSQYIELQSARVLPNVPPAQRRQQLHFRFVPIRSVPPKLRRRPTAPVVAQPHQQHVQQACRPAAKVLLRDNQVYKQNASHNAFSDFFNGTSTSDICPKCDEILATTKERREHCFKFHYDSVFTLNLHGNLTDVEAWLAANLGNESENLDRACLLCPGASALYRGRQDLLVHIGEEHPGQFDRLRMEYREACRHERRCYLFRDTGVHLMLCGAPSPRRKYIDDYLE